MDMYAGKVGFVVEKAQVSITWLPRVLMILIDWPACSRWVAKERAGMVGMISGSNDAIRENREEEEVTP